MRRGFDGEVLEPEEERRERELTLGPVALLALISGLVLLCGLCFGLGYAAGRRSPVPGAAAAGQPAAGTPAAGTPGTTQAQANALSKPPAAGVVPAVTPPAVLADMPQSGATTGSGGANPLTSYAPAGQAASAVTGQSLVKPAMPQEPTAAQQGSGLQVQPALQPSAGLMVQIAAVSHPGDANVLMNALRRRGYAVTARHEAADSLIHVQIGPFSTVNEANAMCQKLLGDGYNAVVVP